MAYIPHEKNSRTLPGHRPGGRDFRSDGIGRREYLGNNAWEKESYTAPEYGEYVGYDQLVDNPYQQRQTMPSQPKDSYAEKARYYDQPTIASERRNYLEDEQEDKINLRDIVRSSRLAWPKKNVWAPIAVLIVSNAFVGISVWQWQNGKQAEMSGVMTDDRSTASSQVRGEENTKEKDTFGDYCQYRGGKIETKVQDGQSKRICQLASGEVCEVEALYSGRCPQTPVVSILEPIDCAIEKALLDDFGTVATSEEKIKELLPTMKNLKGSLCVVRAADKGLQVDKEVELLARLEKNGWIPFATSIKPERIVNQYYKDTKFLYLDINREPLGGWEGPLAKERKTICSQPAISCFQDYEIYTTMSMGVGEGLERK